MSYFRNSYQSFAEFQREAFNSQPTLGKEELELLMDLEDEDDYDRPRRKKRPRPWD